MNSNKKKKQFFSNRNIMWLATIIIIIFFMIQNISAVLSGMKCIISLLFPFLLGAEIAFVMNVPMKSIEEKWFKRWQKHTKLKRPLAYIITLLLIIAVIFIALFIIIPVCFLICFFFFFLALQKKK